MYGDGSIRVFDSTTGKETKCIKPHSASVNSIQFSKDLTMFITASKDTTAKIFDAKTLQCIRTIKSDCPLNAAAFSPLFQHCMVGGGLDASLVTTHRGGHFEVDFYNMVYGDYLGHVKGHFGPVNALAFSPNGKMFASGGEEGIVRLHHFDNEYLHGKHSY